MAQTDPLRDLIVDGASLNREAIAGVLRGIIAIDAESGTLVTMPGFGKLDAKRKVLTVLLARKAASLLEIVSDETLSATQVIGETALAEGTVHPTLKGLREMRLVRQTADRSYFIPNAQINSVLEAISQSRSKKT